MTTEEDQLTLKECTILLSFDLKKNSTHRTVSCVRIDFDRLTFDYCEYLENDFYGNTESLLIQWGLVENQSHTDLTLLTAKRESLFGDHQKMQQLFATLSVQPKDISTAFHSYQLSSKSFEILFKTGELSKVAQRETHVKIAAFMIEHLQLWNNNAFIRKFVFKEYLPSAFLRIDLAAIRALSIHSNESSSNSSSSIFSQISQFIHTKMGLRVLREWLFQPLQDLNEIRYRTTIVRTYINNTELRRQVKRLFKKLPDLDKLITKLARLKFCRRNNTGLTDCYKLYSAFKLVQSALPELRDFCVCEDDSNLVRMLFNIDSGFHDFFQMIEQSIDLERVAENGECFINPICSNELQLIKSELIEKRRELEVLRLDLEDSLGNVNLITIQKAGLVFEANKERAVNFFRTSATKFNLLTTRKTTVTFSFKELVVVSNSIDTLKLLYEDKQTKFIEQVLQFTSEYLPLFEAANIAFVEQDILSGFAELYTNPSQNSPFCLAEVIASESPKQKFLQLKDSWHMCVQNCISNNLLLDSTSQTALVLTGPNMGGKSTFIRQVAICVLLAHVGCPVPAKSCQLTLVSSIFTRVGASDIQLKGISTFMNEMIETATMLSSAEPNSLLIIDELGRGTSIIEGRALAQAILEDVLEKKGCFCLFATHFFELTKLVEKYEQIKNCSMKVVEKNGQLLFTYQVVDGVVGKSFGISLIASMGFPADIVRQAKIICGRLEGLSQ